MNVLIVYCHPEPKSFNGALFRQAIDTFEAGGHAVKTSDLYAMHFDPVSDRRNFTSVQDAEFFKQQLEEMYASDHDGFAPDILAEIEKVEWCDLMIFQFPLWWFGLPAALKGWVDRVFVMGRVYGGGRYYEDGVFKGKKAMLSLTTGGPEELYQKGGWNGDLEAILRPIHRGILEFTGFSVLAPHVVFGPTRKSDEERVAVLESYAVRLDTVFLESPIDVGHY